MKTILMIMNIEFYKIIKKKRYRFFLGIELLLFLLVLLLLFNRDMALPFLSISSIPYSLLNILYVVVLPVLILILTNDLFSSEFDNGSIATILSKPVSLFKIYFSKLLIIFFIVISNLMFFSIFFSLTSIYLNDTNMAIKILLAYLLTIIPIAVYILYMVFIAIITDSATTHVFTVILLYILNMLIKIFLPGISVLIFTYNIGFYNMWIGYSLPIKNNLNVLVSLISWSIIFFIMGYFKFEKKRG